MATPKKHKSPRQGQNKRSKKEDYELIWGRQPVREALSGPLPVQRLLLQEGSTGSVVTEIKQQAAERGIPLDLAPRVKLDALVQGENHQGVLAYTAPYRYWDMNEMLEQVGTTGSPPFILILDHIQDPHNLGSLLRTAAAAGVNGVIIPRDRACGVTPAVYKASAGNLLHLPVARVVNLGREIEQLKSRGFWIAGADMVGEDSFYEAEIPFPLALILGAEGKGLSRLLKDKCDLLLNIPMAKEVLSLNVAVAGGIIIYEIYRRRMSQQKRGD